MWPSCSAIVRMWAPFATISVADDAADPTSFEAAFLVEDRHPILRGAGDAGPVQRVEIVGAGERCPEDGRAGGRSLRTPKRSASWRKPGTGRRCCKATPR